MTKTATCWFCNGIGWADITHFNTGVPETKREYCTECGPNREANTASDRPWVQWRDQAVGPSHPLYEAIVELKARGEDNTANALHDGECACTRCQPPRKTETNRIDLLYVMADCNGDYSKAQRRIDRVLDARDEEAKRLREALEQIAAGSEFQDAQGERNNIALAAQALKVSDE